MAIREPIYDAAVVGAGVVGLAVAVALAKAGRRVALVERAPPERRRGVLGFDLRTVALTPTSVDFLRAHGGVADADLAPIEAMHVWEFDGSGSLRFDCDATHDSLKEAGVYTQVAFGTAPGNALERLEYSRGALAFVAENSALTTRLWKTAEQCLDIVPGSSVTGLAQTGEAVVLAGPDLAARLVIGADGANSIIRQLAATTVRYEPSYRREPQRAIATIARAARPHGNVAYQRFGRSGPIALLPLRDGVGVDGDGHANVAVIWSASENESQRLQSLDDDAFRAALGAETEGVLGDFVAVDHRLSFPIRQGLAADFNPCPRILIVGDAARTLHPLAGQGVNVGLEDARSLAAAASGPDLGATGLWRGFARERRTRSKLVMASMRALLAAYCGPHAGNPWMRLARNAAVRFIDASLGVKAQLVREAMGLGPLAVHEGAVHGGAVHRGALYRATPADGPGVPSRAEACETSREEP